MEILDEARVLDLATMRAPDALVARALERAAQGQSQNMPPFANPSVEWAREVVSTGPSSGRGSQDIVSAMVPLDFARPMSARSLVASESASLRSEASATRVSAVLEAMRIYYEAALAAQRVEVRAEAVGDLEEAARVLARREGAGTASGYESSRLRVALELGRSAHAEAVGAYESHKARLAAVLAIPAERCDVRAELKFAPISNDDALVVRRLEALPVLRYARESARLAGEARDRSDWAWLPVLEAGGGLKRVSNPGGADGVGYVIGASIDLPVFDRGQSLRAKATGAHAVAAVREDALRRNLVGDVAAARAELASARRELARFDVEALDAVHTLLGAVQSGYREGARSVVELLDAQRARTEVAERRIELLGIAKRAEATVRALTGELR
ncbi:MAG: TolC family protein [Polyangiales bacterium]